MRGAAEEIRPRERLHISAEYRGELAEAMLRRALRRAAGA